MEKTINIDFNNSSTITLGYSGDILYSGIPHWAESTHTHGALALYNLSGTSLSNGLTLSAAPPSAAANAVFGGSYISLSTDGVSTTVHVTGLQSSGSYLTTAAHSTHNHGEAPSITGFIGGTIGSAGWSLSIPDFLLTAAKSDHTHSQYIPIGNSTQYATSYLVNTFLTTAAPSTHIHGVASGTNITIGSSSNGLALSVRPGLGTNTSISGGSASMTGNTSGLTLHFPEHSLDFLDSNGVSFGASVDGYSTTITASVSVTPGGNNISLGGNTAGTLTLISSGTANIIGGNNITLSQDGNTFTIIGAAAGTGGAGTGFTSVSTVGSDIVGTLASNGLNIGVPNYLTTAMQSDAGSNFIGLNTSIEGANMTANSSGITISVPMATATAANAVLAGDYISISTNGGNTTVSAINLQPTSAMSDYQLVANSSLSLGTNATQSFFYTSNSSLLLAVSNSSLLQLVANSTLSLGTGATQSFVHTSNSSLFQATSQNSLSLAVSQSSLFQHTSVNSQSLGTTYTSHTHSNLYIPLSASTAYQTSVLDNTFAVTSHTHTEGNVYFVNSLGSNLTWGSSTSGGSTSIFATAGGGTGGGTGGVAIRGSGTYIQSTGTVQFSNSNGLIFGLSNGTMTASMSQASLAFSDSNGVSFGLYSSNASGSTITASVAVGGGGSNTVYGIGNTASDSSMSYSDGQAYSISASNNITVRVADKLIQLWGANPGIVGLGNTATVPFTSGSVRISGINLTVNTSSSGASQYLQISAPAMGYLFFSNTNGHSWGSSVNGMSTSIYIIT